MADAAVSWSSKGMGKEEGRGGEALTGGRHPPHRTPLRRPLTYDVIVGEAEGGSRGRRWVR